MENDKDKKSGGYGKRPWWQIAVIYVVIAVVVYGLGYYFLAGKKNVYGSNPTSLNTQPVTTPAAAATNAQQITVVGTEFSFNPAVINVKKDIPVQITFKNNGTYAHNLTISDLNVQTNNIDAGGQDVLSFTPTAVGQFTFTCTVPGHADRGMTGTLNVQ